MPVAQEVDQIARGIYTWQFFDPAVKADLFSTALETSSGTFLIDPIAVGIESLRTLQSWEKISGIVITNENHERAAAWFADKFQAPVYLHEVLRDSVALPRAAWLQDNATISLGLTAVAIEGGPLGETAVHFEADGGTLVLGDALINFEPNGFALLPAKYCSDFKLMRRSLPKLLDYPFERMLFAHGTPLLRAARERLEHLLAANR